MKNFLQRKKIKEGTNTLLSPKNKAMSGVSFSLLCLQKGQTITLHLQQAEALITTLSGSFRITENDTSYTDLGNRKDVFDGKAFSAYVRNNKARYTIKAEKKSELALTQVELSKKELLLSGNALEIIPPKHVTTKTVGKKNWKRTVYTIIPPSFNAVRMIAGETLNPPGNWSSVPPHKHDTQSVKETIHQEFYFYKITPTKGFAYQRLYDNKSLDENYCLKNNDLVVIPKGFHPICASPGHTLYYFWVLVGKNRQIKSTIDKPFNHLPK